MWLHESMHTTLSKKEGKNYIYKIIANIYKYLCRGKMKGKQTQKSLLSVDFFPGPIWGTELNQCEGQIRAPFSWHWHLVKGNNKLK